MKSGSKPYHPSSISTSGTPISDIKIGGPNGTADHSEAKKSTSCQPLGAACDAQHPEDLHDSRVASRPSGERASASPSAPPTQPSPTNSARHSSGRPRSTKTKRPKRAALRRLDPSDREQPAGLTSAGRRHRDWPALKPQPGVIIVDDGIVVKTVRRRGTPDVFTKTVTKISPSNRGILSRIKQKGQLFRWDPQEDLPWDAIDEEGGAEDVELIFDCDDILGPEWKGRDLDPDDPTAQASGQGAKKLEAASRRVVRFNAFGREATGLSMEWIEEIEGSDGRPTMWRIPGIFYREF